MRQLLYEVIYNEISHRMSPEVLHDIDFVQEITELRLCDVLGTDLLHGDCHGSPLCLVSMMTSPDVQL